MTPEPAAPDRPAQNAPAPGAWHVLGQYRRRGIWPVPSRARAALARLARFAGPVRAVLGALALVVALVGVGSNAARTAPSIPPCPRRPPPCPPEYAPAYMLSRREAEPPVYIDAQREPDSTAYVIARAWLQPDRIMRAVAILIALAGLRELRKLRKRVDHTAVDFADVNLRRRAVRFREDLSPAANAALARAEARAAQAPEPAAPEGEPEVRATRVEPTPPAPAVELRPELPAVDGAVEPAPGAAVDLAALRADLDAADQAQAPQAPDVAAPSTAPRSTAVTVTPATMHALRGDPLPQARPASAPAPHRPAQRAQRATVPPSAPVAGVATRPPSRATAPRTAGATPAPSPDDRSSDGDTQVMQRKPGETAGDVAARWASAGAGAGEDEATVRKPGEPHE